MHNTHSAFVWKDIRAETPKEGDQILVKTESGFFAGKFNTDPGFYRCINERGEWYCGFEIWMPIPEV